MKKTLVLFLVGVFIGWNLAKPNEEKITFENLNTEYKELIDSGASKVEVSAFYDKAMAVYKQHLISQNKLDVAEKLVMGNKSIPIVAADKLFDTSSGEIKPSPQLENIWEFLKSKPLK